ncbi:MAG: aminotransferase class V-fold PLP-dependent enzyme [Alteromonadaceae bacterium]|nr:aminotransferase class V-fold PLP-dependent enzyme [Alteromonadaceae bacterium]
MLKKHYQKFLSANNGVQHYACHSHHYWPDITRDAMIAYWDDSAAYVDEKWDFFFQEKVPALQRHIANLLNTQQPEQVVFAPNTHELLFRVLTSFDLSEPLKIVTTDSEFHSFTRQVNRLDELNNVEIVRVQAQPFATFETRFVEAIKANNPDLIFFSQVFFNSGVAIGDLTGLLGQISDSDAVIMVDGYHAFTALPVDISDFRSRIFYLAGGYKYAQGGEGVCFMHCPKNVLLRPLYTGWYAEFGELQKFKSRKVDYSKAGFHYAGSTMDYSGVYRQLAVFDLWGREKVSITDVHHHVQYLQKAFLQQLSELKLPFLNESHLLTLSLDHHGHFLAFELEGDMAARLHDYLKSHKIVTDYRGNRLRFGFAPYHEVADIDLNCLRQFDA